MNINKINNFTSLPVNQAKAGCTPEKNVSDRVELGTKDNTEAIKPAKKWLFMNYIAADCNLKEPLTDIIDNQELVGSDKNTHIVALEEKSIMKK